MLIYRGNSLAYLLAGVAGFALGAISCAAAILPSIRRYRASLNLARSELLRGATSLSEMVG